jgi:hypothetical protein
MGETPESPPVGILGSELVEPAAMTRESVPPAQSAEGGHDESPVELNQPAGDLPRLHLPQDHEGAGVVVRRVAVTCPGPVEEGVLVEAVTPGEPPEMVETEGGEDAMVSPCARR